MHEQLKGLFKVVGLKCGLITINLGYKKTLGDQQKTFIVTVVCYNREGLHVCSRVNDWDHKMLFVICYNLSIPSSIMFLMYGITAIAITVIVITEFECQLNATKKLIQNVFDFRPWPFSKQ